MPPDFLLDPATFAPDRVAFDSAAIRHILPQRFELEQLDAIFLLDTDRQLIAGYKDVREDEFWVRGHMPNYPIMPGVLMCEAAAQLCSFYIVKHGGLVTAEQIVGFGGMEEVRFRAGVRPGDRLYLVAQGTKLHRRQCTFSVQGFVNGVMAFQAVIIGVPLPKATASA